MNVFIGWSGEKSKAVARALRDWLPHVMQELNLFMSEEDIADGARWGQEIDSQLNRSDFGIICLTRMNKDSSWVHYEAGALAKDMADGHVVPLLIDIGPADVGGPLARFHQTRGLSRDDIWGLVHSIHEATEDPILSEKRLESAFERWWEAFDEAVTNLPEENGEEEEEGEATDTDVPAVMTEILENTRSLNRRMDALEKRPERRETAEESSQARRKDSSEQGKIKQDEAEKALHQLFIDS